VREVDCNFDGIVPEPVGGAHRNWEETAAALRQALRDHLWELKGKTPGQLLSARYEKLPPHLYPLPGGGEGRVRGLDRPSLDWA